jgi:hypothetical protein
MKAPVLFLALALSAASLVADVAPGDTLEQAVATLGAPRGRLQVAGRNLVYFERGEIEVRDGRVTRVDLLTPEEHAARQAREAQQRDERETRRNELLVAGTAERDSKLADENFRAAPVAYQVSYWQGFAARYPGVSVAEPLTIARLKLNEQLEQKAREARRQEEQEARLAEQRDRPEFYPLYTGSYYRRYRPYYSPGFGDISYDFWDKPLPVYTSPRGEPAGTWHAPRRNRG